ncbi:hypothetical protein P152DRAFT_452243 [Eremomyces bilateralis CBS 781.70]|uniref:Uncharacterized protein n=1 Tax=Eremomyces bilateralis CBS 781.70 TaxID=1392243 RepID=A0A6G1FTK2_9PEZI|nr:uncharacterized protein P152DRAFT_452243 [Eremomyces bilateralis CBS 781.70]KAF1809127.1 hypothetical protein P152DRAFT_452243 [Eremomyces bilateralis CBS 781.70]
MRSSSPLSLGWLALIGMASKVFSQSAIVIPITVSGSPGIATITVPIASGTIPLTAGISIIPTPSPGTGENIAPITSEHNPGNAPDVSSSALGGTPVTDYQSVWPSSEYPSSTTPCTSYSDFTGSEIGPGSSLTGESSKSDVSSSDASSTAAASSSLATASDALSSATSGIVESTNAPSGLQTSIITPTGPSTIPSSSQTNVAPPAPTANGAKSHRTNWGYGAFAIAMAPLWIF